MWYSAKSVDGPLRRSRAQRFHKACYEIDAGVVLVPKRVSLSGFPRTLLSKYLYCQARVLIFLKEKKNAQKIFLRIKVDITCEGIGHDLTLLVFLYSCFLD